MIKNTFEKIRDWIKDKIEEKKILKESVYFDLTPADSIEDEEALKTLHWAIINPRIKNIALTAPYGAGKSSVIDSYLKQHKSCKALKISLATFDGRTIDNVKQIDADGNYVVDQIAQKEIEDELEKGILKQLFYKVEADKIPLSRYRKLHHKSIIKYIVRVLFFIIAILSGVYLIFPEKVKAYIAAYRDEITSFDDALIIFAACTFVAAAIGYICRFITSKFIIKEISVGDFSAHGEETQSNSVFNKNIDEMLYFFERTHYNVVFIEDLDRFNDTYVFSKLREINSILNNYDVLKKKRKITFIYAIRDDLFQDKTERTKFFDFIIPIIPVINVTNSGEIMRRLLGIEEGKRNPNHNISAGFVSLVSTYIGDMRILRNIINEFWMYKKTIKDSKDVKIIDENMLGLMIYKNFYPADFALLEQEEGYVKDAFSHKVDAIKNIQQEIERKRNDLRKYQEDIALSIKDIKILILSELTANEGVVRSIDVQGKNYGYTTLLEDSFSFDLIRNTRFEVHYCIYNNLNSKTRIVNNITETDQRYKELFERYDRQARYYDKTVEDVKKESEKTEKALYDLSACTMKQLFEKYDFEEVLPQHIKDNKMLMFMLRHGYINEHYAEYINYFHEGSISKEEHNFILSIRNFDKENNFDYEIKHCSNVINKLQEHEFGQMEALNYDILDTLLLDVNEKNKLKMFIKQVVNDSLLSQKFIKGYIERGKNIEQFIKIICNSSDWIWMNFMYDEELSEEKKLFYLKCLISYCDVKDILNNNISYEDKEKEIFSEHIIKDFIEYDENILIKLLDISWARVKVVLNKLDIKFKRLNLSGVDENVIKDIISMRIFEINHEMLESLCEVLDPNGEEELFRCNYKWLLKLNNEELLNYVYDEIHSYVNDIILSEITNTEEETNEVDDIIQRLFETEQGICLEIIKKEHLAYWDRLSDCLAGYEDKNKKEIWDYLLLNDRTSATWENFMLYYDLFGLTQQLLKFIDNHVGAILSNSPEYVDDKVVKELIISDLSNDSFEKIIQKYQLDEFNNDCDEFAVEKLEIMIRNHYFEFIPERFDELKEISREVSNLFIEVNYDYLLKNISEFNLDIEDFKFIFNWIDVKKEEVLLLLNMIMPSDLDNELSQLIMKYKVELPKSYVEAMWKITNRESKLKLLLSQMSIYDLDEIAVKFNELGKEYTQLSVRNKHKYELEYTEYNVELCDKLCERKYISPYHIETRKVSKDIVKNQVDQKVYITGFVKKKAAQE